jgi:hypothetical protein
MRRVYMSDIVQRAKAIMVLLVNELDLRDITLNLEDGVQVEFHIDCNEETDYDAGPCYETEQKISALGGEVGMNDCEGCYGEGLVWVK